MSGEDDLKFTGERFHPEVKGSIELEHLHRYAYALPFAEGKAVLDIACGEGYGSAFLARSAASVIGVDIADEAVAHAQKKYPLANLTFRQGSCARIPVDDHCIDLVVSFETIEHHMQHEEMLAEIKRVLKADGLLLISSPDKEIYSDRDDYHNPYHVKELYKAEFETLLQRHFKNSALLGQKVIIGSAIMREAGESKVAFLPFDAPVTPRPADFRYNMILASDALLPDAPSSILDCSADYNIDNARHLQSEVEQSETLLNEARQHIQRLEAIIRQQQDEATTLTKRISERDKTIDHLLKVYAAFSLAQSDKPAHLQSSEPSLSDDIEAIRHSAFFNSDFYLSTNTDLHPATDAAWHYLTFGSNERRDPGPFFSTTHYLTKNPDVAASGSNALLHYERQGVMEGLDPPRRQRPLIAPPQTQEKDAPRSLLDFFRKKKSKQLRPWINPKAEVPDSVLSTIVAERDFIPLYEGSDAKADAAKVICFYLPQFHAIPENDKWWGKGFTEWTNVRTGRPQFEGHHQPHVPGELGYYDLLDPAVQHRQVELAKLYGVGGFCFYFYWFGGHRLLEAPIENYLNDKSLDLPFCLCWANENWTRRWDGLDTDVLIAQDHSEADDLAFIEHVAHYMRDARYIKVDGKPLLIIYRPNLLPSAETTVARWRNWCRQNGIGEIYLAYTQSFERIDPAKYGLDAAIEFPPNGPGAPNITADFKLWNAEAKHRIYDLHDLADASEDYLSTGYTLFRSVCPSWDNAARRKAGASIFMKNTPASYQRWLSNAISEVRKSSSADQRLVFVNAWNEWGEGAHLEPDAKYGYAYLEATRLAQTRASSKAGMKTPRLETAKIAVIIHAFHMDVFREIVETLGNGDSRLRVFVTTTQEREAEAKEILAQTPFEATVHVYDNHGRDVLPFLSLLKEIDLASYAFILKLHTKKSLHRQDGEDWRQQAVSCLATFEQREWILRQMCEAPDIGMVGPRDHVVPMHFYHGSNIENMKWIAARLGFETLSLDKESFIAGTMFMARTEALIPILNIALGPQDFESEAGQLDGTMAHAIERALTYSAAAAGLGIASIGPGDAAKYVAISTVANQEFAFAARS